jgi:hypothetical protein
MSNAMGILYQPVQRNLRYRAAGTLLLCDLGLKYFQVENCQKLNTKFAAATALRTSLPGAHLQRSEGAVMREIRWERRRMVSEKISQRQAKEVGNKKRTTKPRR